MSCKCAVCGVVTCIVERIAYVRHVNGAALQGCEYSLCRSCAARARSHPNLVAAGLHRRWDQDHPVS